MNDILAQICAEKRRYVDGLKSQTTLAELVGKAARQTPPRGFATALDLAAARGYALIAEIKKASPSAGLIRADFDPPSLARAYLQGGAACLSVLTDRPYFQGEDGYLADVKAAVDLPVLRKDFMLDPWQITESRALGADCILLILAALSDDQAAELEETALTLGMDVLIEVHDDAEFERALKRRSPLLGVNNRNLKTMVTDLTITEQLGKRLPPGKVLIAESGLKTAADLARMEQAGAKRFLIGESLMREQDVAAATRALLARAA